MKGAWISVNQAEIFPGSILPDSAISSFALAHMAVLGTELALDFSVSEGSKERGQLCLNKSFLRKLGMRQLWKPEEMNPGQGGNAGCTKT